MVSNEVRISLTAEELRGLIDLLVFELSDKILADKPVPDAFKTLLHKVREASNRQSKSDDRTTD